MTDDASDPRRTADPDGRTADPGGRTADPGGRVRTDGAADTTSRAPGDDPETATDGGTGTGPTRPAGTTGGPSPGPGSPAGYAGRTTVIARSTVRLVVPVILITSIALLLQGHNLPGGGFIGAVLTTTAFVLVYVVFGIEFLREVVGLSAEAGGERLIAGYRWLFGAGLALAAGSGIVPVLYDLPFLMQGFVILEHVPLYGEFEVASALAFDLGVYFTVVGALLAVVGEVGAE